MSRKCRNPKGLAVDAASFGTTEIGPEASKATAEGEDTMDRIALLQNMPDLAGDFIAHPKEGEASMRTSQSSQSPMPLGKNAKPTTKLGKILVVDDEEVLRMILNLVLSDAGFDVTEASNGLEGLQLLSREYFDLVVTDVDMPIKDGLTMISEARTIAPEVKFIVYSGSDCQAMEQAKALCAGSILKVLTKPMPAPALVAAIKDALHTCGRDCRAEAGHGTQSRHACADANPLFAAVLDHFDRQGAQAAYFNCERIEPPASRNSCWRLHPSWALART